MARKKAADPLAEFVRVQAQFAAHPLEWVMANFDWKGDASIQLVPLASQYRERFPGYTHGPDVWQCEFLAQLGEEIRKRGFDGKTLTVKKTGNELRGKVGRGELADAAASLGAGGFTVFRRIILPNLIPGILAGILLAFARALGEFGSLVLISGNIPFKTEVSAVFIRSQIESGNVSGAAAVSVVLLAISLLLLVLVSVFVRLSSRKGMFG